MAPMKPMKAGVSKAMTKGMIAKTIAEELDLKQKVVTEIMKSLATTAIEQVKAHGKFVFPGFCMIKTRVKPATEAGEKEYFGRMVMMKAKPAKTVVKAFPVAALKNSISSR